MRSPSLRDAVADLRRAAPPRPRGASPEEPPPIPAELDGVIPRRPRAALRRARGDRPPRRRHALRRVQAPLRRDARLRIRAHLGLSGGIVANNGILFSESALKGAHFVAAGLPAPHPARLPAEHHRLHGGQGVRARGHRQGRGQARDGRGVRPGAEADRRDRRLVRRGQLRHVRPRVRRPGCCSCGRTPASRSWARARRPRRC